MSPLEKCAKAMADADDAHFFWEAMSVQAKSGYMDAARACLEAIREPDIITHNAGAFSQGQAKEPAIKVGPDGVLMLDWERCDPTKVFKSMIDHILSQ